MKLQAIVAAAALLLPAAGSAQDQTPDAPESGYVESNGVRYYYETHGTGEPLLLLHGGLGSGDMFEPILPVLTEHREVILVDLHGHGRTGLGERDAIDFDLMADDVAVILDELGHDHVDVLGYSMGGGVALQLAAQHPDKVRRLVLLSAAHTTDAFHPEMRPMQAQVGADMAPMMVGTPMYESYARVAPHPEDFPRLLDAMGAYMRRDLDWSEDVRSLSMPTMIAFGDADMYQPEYVVEMYALLGGGLRDAGWMRENLSRNRLAIIPNATHYDILYNPLFVPTVLPFLDGDTAAPTWPAQVPPEPKRSGYVDANGVRYYYEVRGEGEPLVLLHGGFGSIDMFAPILPELTETRQVIGIDMLGHGRTALGDREDFVAEDVADDVDAVLEQLGYDQVDAMGYSMGAGVAFRLAVQHPERVRRLVVLSITHESDGFHEDLKPAQQTVGAGMMEAMRETPMYQSYVRVAPNPEDFPRLLDAVGRVLRRGWDWSDDVPRLSIPTMLVFGDGDGYQPENIVEMYELLGGGLRDAGWQREHMSANRLAILPNATHYDVFYNPLLVPAVLPFLNGETHATSWAEVEAGQAER